MSRLNERTSLLGSRGDVASESIQSSTSYAPFELPRPDSGHASVSQTVSVRILSGSTSRDQDESRLPLPRATFVVTNAALGAGMLAFPQAYGKTGGVAQALTVQAFLIVLIIGAFLILGYCGQVCRTTNYQDTIKNFCGPTAQIACQVIVAVYMFGSNVTYMILIGDQLTKVIGHGGWYFDRRFIITVVSCICILPLCIPKKLKVISYSSVFGALGALYVCLMVVSNYHRDRYKHSETEGSSSNSHFHWTHVFGAVPVICFGFQCHVTSVAVYAELKRPSLQRFGIVTTCATAICALIYSLTGVYGFLTFGHNVKSDILVNYDRDDAVADAGRAVIVIVVFSTYAICHFVGRSAFLGLWIKARKLTVAEIEGFENKRRIITTIIWFLCSLALSIIVPTIGKAIAVVGAFAAHFIFTFPGLCLIQLVLQHGMELTAIKKNLGLVVGVMYVVIGVFLFGETVTLALMEDIDPKHTF